MPEYRYTARELGGRQVIGKMTATSERDALGVLATKSLFPIRLEAVDDVRSRQAGGGKRISGARLATFYNQLSDLLRSGVPLLRALELLQNQASNKAMSSVLLDLKEQVSEGNRLADSMQRHPGAFRDLHVSLVKAGEEGSFLEDVLQRLADLTEHQEELRGRVRGALVYPAFLIVMGVMIISVLLTYFVPKFEPMFDRMADAGTLPWATTSLMSVSEVAQNYWLLVAIAVAGCGIAVYGWYRTPEGRQKYDEWLLKFPLLGMIVRNLALARFCRVLGTMLRNGVPILQALRIAKDATGNRVLSEAIAEAAEHVSAGKSLARPLADSGVFTPDTVEMVAIGEESNNLENVLINIADGTERRVQRQIDMAVRLLEPILLVMMAGVILYVAVALMVPIFQSSNL